jgi:hypothetical protein
MEKKNAVQITHDLKSPIDALTELVSVVHEMSTNITPEHFTDLKIALERLASMSSTLSAYMQERYEENANELAEMRARKLQTTAPHAQLVVLENDPLLIQTYRYIAQRKNKNIVIYSTSEELLANLDKHSKEIPICLDYELDNDQNGIEIAKILNEKGYKNLYLASGYEFSKSGVPDYLRILSDKKDILKLV